MYNTNVSSSIKKIVIEKYNVSYVPMVIEIDDKGNTKDITAEFIKNNNIWLVFILSKVTLSQMALQEKR